MGWFGKTMKAVCCACVALLCLAVMPASSVLAQETLSDKIAKQSQHNNKAPMVVDANTITYDDKANIVIATGDVQLHQQGRTLQADVVRYDRGRERVFAEGNVRITDAEGNITYAEKAEVTDDFKDGFVNTVLMTTPDKTRFGAARGERMNGDVTVFDRGVYTACEPCKKDPSKAPIWQLKAKRIVHKEAERTIYYEDASLEFLGVPIAYAPYFAAPDPTVKRKTGFLAPKYLSTSELGFGVEVPFFWAIAPNYDVTLTPTITTRQGPLMRADFRHRLMTGAYDVRLAGIFQQEPGAFPAPPKGSGTRDFRGSAQTRGEFYLNEKWTWGWNLNFLSDKFFLKDYSIATKDLTEIVSTLYFTGLGERNVFEARGYYFMGLTLDDRQKYLPLVHPVIDHSYRFKSSPLGGELALKSNITSLSRAETEYVGYDPLVPKTFGVTRGSCLVYASGRCIVLGASGRYLRSSTELSWRRTFIDPLGQVWTPFASLRGDVVWSELKTDGGIGGINANLPSFFAGDETAWRFMPSVGFEYKYPLVAYTMGTTHILEPIAQIISRPSEMRAGRLPNEDAQSLMFDDTNLFAANRYSGWDRTEGGTRATVGLQYSAHLDNGAWISALVGQSYHLAGRNSYASPDPSNVGLESGLDQSQSDYITRLYVQPVQSLGFSVRTRHDNENFGIKRLEVAGHGTFANVSTLVAYGRYAAQPQLAEPEREGVYGALNYKFAEYWSVGAGARYMVDKKRFDFTRLSLGYNDECTTANLDYIVDFSGVSNKDPVHKFLLRLNLRTLGDAGISTSVGNTE